MSRARLLPDHPLSAVQVSRVANRLVPCGRCMRYHHPMGYRGAGRSFGRDMRNGKTCPETPGGTCDNAVIADDTGIAAGLDDGERSGPGCQPLARGVPGSLHMVMPSKPAAPSTWKMSSRRTIGSAVPAANSGWRISIAAMPRGSETGSVSNFSDNSRFASSRSAGNRRPGHGLVARTRGGAMNVHAGHEDATTVAREHVTHAHKQGDVGQLAAQRRIHQRVPVGADCRAESGRPREAR